MLKPIVDEEACIGCEACVAACPNEAMGMYDDGIAELANPEACEGIGACAEACPTGAITIEEEDEEE